MTSHRPPSKAKQVLTLLSPRKQKEETEKLFFTLSPHSIYQTTKQKVLGEVRIHVHWFTILGIISELRKQYDWINTQHCPRIDTSCF